MRGGLTLLAGDGNDVSEEDCKGGVISLQRSVYT